MNSYYVTLIGTDGKTLTTEKVVADSYSLTNANGFTTFTASAVNAPVVASFKKDCVQAIRLTPEPVPVSE